MTDANGDYSFGNVAVGNYKVMVVAPSGQEFTLQDVGNNNSIDSDVNSNGMSGTFCVTAGGTVTIDAGLKDAPGSLSGRYFMDSDGDAQDNGEMGIAGVVVTLLETGATTTTDANGDYSFGGLAPGDYTVEFTDPNGVLAGKQLVASNVGPDATDSDAIGDTALSTISNISVTAGNDTPDNDAGAETIPIVPGSLSGTYFMDNNDNDVEDAGDMGIAGVLVTLVETGATTTTDGNGDYSFAGLAPGTYSVEFRDPNGVLAGKQLVAQNDPNGNGDDTNDSDAAGDINLSSITGISVVEATDTPNNDAGAENVNIDPTADDDAGKTCADEATMVDVLANDVDPDGGTLTVTSVNGQMVTEGGAPVDIGGVAVSLSGGKLVFDGSGSAALEALNINEQSVITYTYEVSDGQGGTASADVDLTFCGTANSVTDIDGSLPTGDVKFQIIDEGNPVGSSSDVWTIKLSGTGDARLDGLVIAEAYCLAVFDPILAGNFGTNIDNAPMNFGTISVLDDMSVIGSSFTNIKPGVAANEVDNIINWILNQDFASQGFTDAEIQGAIWGLTDDLIFVADPASDVADAQTILDQAIAQGGSYQAGAGDLVGLYIDPNAATEAAGHTQPYVVAVAFDDLDCIC